MNKDIRTSRLIIHIIENQFNRGGSVMITDKKTKSSYIITPDVGFGLMIDPNSEKDLQKVVSDTIKSIIKVV